MLSGTVPADADALDVTTADGATTEYPLTGPVLDGDRRVFLLDLGAQDWRKLGLVRGGQRRRRDDDAGGDRGRRGLQRQGRPDADAATISVTPGPLEQTAAMRAWNAAFQACLAASGAFPALPAAPPLASTP